MSEKPTTAAGEEQKSVSLFWHALDAPEVLNSLNVAAEAGLTSEEAEKRLAHYGPNELVEKKRTSFLQMLWAQINSFVIWLLIGAAVISALLGDYVEAGAVADIAAHEATACAIFEQYPDVDAIVGSDVVASVALQEASRRGIEVPADLQVIAYDGTLMAETAGKRLTAIRQDFPAIAAALAVRMDSQIAADGGPASPSKNDSASDVDTQPTPEEVIPVALIPGETTR